MHLRFVAVCVAIMCAVPAIARAQNRAFVGGLGGITFGTETSSIFGAQAGGRVAAQLVVFGEIGRMQNVLPSELQDQLDELLEQLEEEAGVTIDLDVKVPAFYGLGGIRWSNDRRIAPYVEGGAGFARLSFNVDAEVDGIDVSEEAERELEQEDLEATKFLLALGGGINAQVSDAMRIDVGYRYHRVFTDDPVINTSVLYGALKFWF